MKYFLFYLSFFLNFTLLAQVYPKLSFTENEGLIGNYVRDLLIDKDGLLWIATENGISIYDGAQFINYDQTDGLPSRKIGALAMDKEGSVYVGCSKGGLVKIIKGSILPCVIDHSDKIHHYRKLHYSQKHNTLFVGTENGLYFLKNEKLIPIYYKRDSTDRSIILSICERDDFIFFTVLKGGYQGIYQLFFNPQQPEKSYTKRIYEKGRFYCNIIDHFLIAGEQNKLLKFDLNDLSKAPKSIEVEKDFFVWQIASYQKNKLLVGGLGDGRFKGGIYEYNYQNDQVQKLNIEQNSMTITSLLYHPEFDLIWIGKENDLTAYSRTQFKYLTPDIPEDIIDVCYANNQLYILTDLGIYCNKDGFLKKIVDKETISKTVEREYFNNLKKQGLYFKEQFDINFGSELVKLVVTNNGVFVQTGKGSLSIPDLKTYLPFGFGLFVMKKDQGAYNYVTYYKLFEYESLKTPYRYNIITNINNKFSGIIKMLSENDIYFFLSSENGLLVRKNNQTLTLDSDIKKLENEKWVDMTFSKNRTLWLISDQRMMLVNFNNHFKIEKQFLLEEIGIKGSSVKWINQNNDMLLIACNDGVYEFKSTALKKGDFRPFFYNKWNGYPFINAIHPTIDNHGQIIVHTSNDIIWINQSDPKTMTLKIDIYDLSINGIKKENTFLNNKKLSYKTNHIAFHFRMIQFPSAKNLFYRYKINNEGWIHGNQVDFQSLRTGKYHITLEVFDKAMQQTYYKEFDFQIIPPIWLTVWFWAIIFTIIAFFIVYLFKWRIKIVQHRTEEKTLLRIQNAELQLRSLQIQMNPHFIFNALNSIQYLVLSKNIKETLTYLGKLAGIIRINLEYASEKSILIKDEVEFINNYVHIELLRFKNKFQFKCVCDGIPEHLCMPPMLIQPIIENAIKHGIQNCDYSGLIELNFKIADELLTILITDNGIGRQAASQIETGSQKKHLGLSVIQQRLQLLNDLNHSDKYVIDIIDIQDNEGNTGTQVTISLPLIY